MCTKDPEIIHRRTREFTGCYPMDRESQTKSRADKQSLLIKLRTGFIGLRAYKNRVDRLTDPICPQCREEPQYLKHWLTRCYCDKKMAMFGDYNGELACLTRCPLEVLPPRSTLSLVLITAGFSPLVTLSHLAFTTSFSFKYILFSSFGKH